MISGAVRDESDESVEEKNDGVVLLLPAHRPMFGDLGDDEEPALPNSWHPFRFDSRPFEGFFTRMQGKFYPYWRAFDSVKKTW